MSEETFTPVSKRVFANAFEFAFSANKNVAEACSPVETAEGGTFHLSEDGQSGFRVCSGELTHVFSVVRGRGNSIVTAAIVGGATFLDCFDGYLPTLYTRHGFTETHREPNWTPGAPDVVFMSR